MSSSRAFSGKVADFSGSETRQARTARDFRRFSETAKGSSRLLNLAAALVLLALPLALSACSSFRPVYGDSGLTNEAVALAYAKPANRLEQLIYQSLALRLGKSSVTDAPLVTITATQESKTLASGTLPNRHRQMVVTATITLTATDGTELFKGTRSAAADYTTNAQVLANQAAETEAAERAAKALAETIRLTLIAALAAPAQ